MAELRFLVKLSRWVWQTFAALLILLAVLVVLGRSAIVKLPDYQQQIQELITEQLGYPVTFNRLDGRWDGLNPTLYLNDFKLFLAEGDLEPAIAVSKVVSELDLMASLYHQRLVWRRLEVQKIAFDLLEGAAGEWSIGLSMGGASGGGLEAAEALLFNSRYIEVGVIDARIRFNSGAESGLRWQAVKVENRDSFHRLQAAVAVDDQKEAARLTIEGRGSPLDWSEFEGKFYLKLQQIQNTGLLRASLQHWLPEAFRHIVDLRTDINGEMWFNLDGTGAGTLSGYLDAAEIPLNWFAEVQPITDFSAQLAGSYQQNSGWDIGVRDIDFNWGELPIEPLSLSYQQLSGDSWGEGTLAVSQLNLAVLADLIAQVGGLPETALQAVSGLSPEGQVSPLHLDLQVADNQKVRLTVRGNLHDVAIDSVKKRPAGRNINGYFEVQVFDGVKGFLELDSPQGMAMWYPAAYEDFMMHGSVRGRLDWRLDQQRKAVVVNSGPLDIAGEEGRGRGYLNLFMPLKKEYGAAHMTLQVGLRDSHTRFRDNYIPKTLDKNLAQWLDEAVGDASITEAGFIWRGSLRNTEKAKRSIQLYLKAEGGDIRFQPDWPELKQLDTVLTVDGAAAQGTVRQAQMLQAKLRDVHYAVVPSTPQKPMHLTVQGQASAKVPDALDILYQSPVGERVSALQDWQTSGETELELALDVPLRSGYQPQISVQADINAGALSDAGQTVSLDRIKTRLNYSTDKGLWAQKVRGYLWQDSPVSGSLKTTEEAIVLTADSKVSVAQLVEQLQLPVAPVLSGSTAVTARLRLPSQQQGEDPSLTIHSQLQGITIDLPEPLGKAANEPLESEFGIGFGDEQRWRYSARLGERVFADLVFQDGELEQGDISIGQPPGEVSEELAAEHHYQLRGHLPIFRLFEWQEVLDRFDQSGGETPDLLQPHINLAIDSFLIADFALQAMTVTGQKQGQTDPWKFHFDSDISAGVVSLPASADDPIKLALSHLALNTDDSETEQANEADDGFLADIDPTQLPFMDIGIEQLIFNQKEMGALSFLMQPTEQGALLSGISGEIGHIQLGSAEQVETVLRWSMEDSVHRTEFEGLLRTGDLAEVFEFWGFPVMMDSESSRFITQLHWAGRPDQYSVAGLAGEIGLGINKGSFYTSPAAPADAAIRAVSLFNFANWLRRLRFDFSDIFKKGVSYEEVAGGVRFDAGNMTFDPPLEVKMPSGRMRLSGSANLTDEQIDANLAMTIPVATNLPWIVALAGGLPAAAGVYVTSKVFEDEVDQLSSFSYSIEGSWADPEIEIDKIFSD